MLHSFIIPAYGETKYLEECIESILNQSIKSEVSITTSTPNAYIENTARKFGINLHVNPEPASIAGDWNFALKTASTKYVTLAHQDDFYCEDYVKCNLERAELNKDMLIQFSDYSERIFGKKIENSIKVRFKKLLLLFLLLRKKGINSKFIKKITLAFGCPVCCPSVFFNTENLKDFTFNNNYRINLDWDAWIRMSRIEGRFIYINRKLMIHRVHGDSETSKNLMQRKTEDRKIFDELWFFPLSRILSLIYSLSYSSFK